MAAKYNKRTWHCEKNRPAIRKGAKHVENAANLPSGRRADRHAQWPALELLQEFDGGADGEVAPLARQRLQELLPQLLRQRILSMGVQVGELQVKVLVTRQQLLAIRVHRASHVNQRGGRLAQHSLRGVAGVAELLDQLLAQDEGLAGAWHFGIPKQQLLPR